MRGVVLTIWPISSADEVVVVRVGFHVDVDMAETSVNVVEGEDDQNEENASREMGRSDMTQERKMTMVRNADLFS